MHLRKPEDDMKENVKAAKNNEQMFTCLQVS
jgi:hypothetical protein